MGVKLTSLAVLMALAACSSSNGNDAGPACPGGTCPIHETCVNGACQCLSGWLSCAVDGGMACTEVQSDSANCGKCGAACGAGQSCLAGSCQCTAVECPGPDGGVCTDLQSDPNNCGQCGSPCPANEQCAGALCQCPGGFSVCPLEDGGSVCTDLQTDPNNCGQCALLCDGGNCQCGSNQSCQPNLGCVCTGTLTACGPNGTDCVDLNSDPENCGGCNKPCPTGDCAGGTCSCNVAPYTKCPTTGVCTNLSSDVHNCGKCNNDCTVAALGGDLSGVSCENGSCVCAIDGGVGTGSICSVGGTPACVDQSSDPGNCGGCGQTCSAPTIACTNGNCSCPTPQELCGSAGSQSCVDITSTPSSCGSCGYDCSVNYAADAGCNQGHCVCTDLQTLCLTVSPQLSCACQEADGGPAGGPGVCKQPTLTFANVATVLNDSTSQFGCATAGCHSAAVKAGGLDLSTAQAAYAGLLGLPDAGPSTKVVCDGGPNGTFGNVPSQTCPCTARVVPGVPTSSYLIDALTDSSALCAGAAPMPIDADGGFHPLSACQIQLLTVWIKQGAVGP